MSPALPKPAPASGVDAARLAWLLVTAVLATPGLAGAIEIEVDTPRERNGYVIVDARVSDLFSARIRESLGRGMPATLQIHTELWRSRDRWFDRLVSSFDASVRIRYEVWNGSYRLERAGQPAVQVSTIDSVEALLSQPWSIPAGRVGDVKPQDEYYVVVYCTLKPLTVEDVEEVEGWLSGEVRSKRRAGFGVITELPRSLFDAVRNFAGFGDQRARTVSVRFGLRDLFPTR